MPGDIIIDQNKNFGIVVDIGNKVLVKTVAQSTIISLLNLDNNKPCSLNDILVPMDIDEGIEFYDSALFRLPFNSRVIREDVTKICQIFDSLP